jgi:thiol:disulfide interchange protein DsbD
MKNIFLILVLIISSQSIAQHNPVSFEISQSGDTAIFHASIEQGWHMYAVNLPDPDGGPLPTEFVFEESPSFILIDGISESEGHTELDDAFGIEVTYFETEATFKQRILDKTKGANPNIKGVVYYMVCNDEMCIPLERPFSFQLK